MKTLLILVGVILIAAGVLALVYGEFSYTEETHTADLKIAKLELKEKENVEVPTWVGVVAIAAGAVTLVVGARRRK